MLSVIIPARNERFLRATVTDVLAKAAGAIEVIVILDGYWPDPPLPDDPRLRILHRGQAQGMRPGINAAVQVARGDWLLKADAHTMWAEGFDVTLREDCHEENWILTPRRYALDPEAWAWDTSNPKYPVDYHALEYPFARPDDATCGLHGMPWGARRAARADVLLDEEMTSQGSAWMMSRRHWDRVGPMDRETYGNFVHEHQELGLKTWLGGGACMVTKRTWYAHLYKGRRYGRGYVLGEDGHKVGSRRCTDLWLHDRWPGQTRPFRWLVEHFAPVPTWPSDWDQVARDLAAWDAGTAA